MPKDSKRTNKPRHMSGKQVKRTTTVEQTSAAIAQEPVAAPAPVAAAAPVAYQPSRVHPRQVRVPRTYVPAINTNYDYVATDLKRIGITAVSIFVVMGVLSFVLPMLMR